MPQEAPRPGMQTQAWVSEWQPRPTPGVGGIVWWSNEALLPGAGAGAESRKEPAEFHLVAENHGGARAGLGVFVQTHKVVRWFGLRRSAASGSTEGHPARQALDGLFPSGNGSWGQGQ